MSVFMKELIKVDLTEDDFINSLKEEIFRLPFTNERLEDIFPVRTKRSNNTLYVEMLDGTKFQLMVKKI
jgi:hypothetical protein